MNIELDNGDIFNIKQTVNGENLFVVLDILSKDIRYAYNLVKKYEYDIDELLSIEEIEVVGNIYEHVINNLRS